MFPRKINKSVSHVWGKTNGFKKALWKDTTKRKVSKLLARENQLIMWGKKDQQITGNEKAKG